MTEIRWKNGGPLFLQPVPGSEFGLVATDQDCCCPPPPPPFCWDCLNRCSYVVSVVDPGELAVSAAPLCETAEIGVTTNFRPYMLAAPPMYAETWPEVNRSVGAVHPQLFCFLSAYVEHAKVGYTDEEVPCGEFGGISQQGLIAVSGGVSICIMCEHGRTPTPFVLRINAGAGASYIGSFDSKCLAGWGWNASAEFDLSSSCEISPAKTCEGYSGEFRILDTPIEITADGTTTSLGAYTTNTTSSNGDPSVLAAIQGYGEAVRDALTATFRITSRPNCKTPIPCDCSASLAGTRWSFEGQDFDWNTGGESWFGPVKFTWSLSGSSPNVVYEFHDPDGPVDGNGNPSRLLLRRRVDVYCDTVDGEPTWVVLMRATAFCYDGGGTQIGQSEDSWLGRLLCYEACADDWHAAGDPIPSGEPEDVVYNGRETFDNECPPAPPRPTVLISQIETC